MRASSGNVLLRRLAHTSRDGALSHYSAFKTEEFSTLEDAQKHIENDVSKNGLSYIRLYQELPVKND